MIFCAFLISDITVFGLKKSNRLHITIYHNWQQHFVVFIVSYKMNIIDYLYNPVEYSQLLFTTHFCQRRIFWIHNAPSRVTFIFCVQNDLFRLSMFRWHYTIFTISYQRKCPYFDELPKFSWDWIRILLCFNDVLKIPNIKLNRSKITNNNNK